MEIRWSDEALEDLDEIIDFVLKKWPPEVAEKILDRVDEVSDVIRNYPEIFPVSKKGGGARKCIVTKYVSMYYEINNNTIDILRFYPNKIDPQSIEL